MKAQIEVITYEQDRLNYFTDLMEKAQKRYSRLLKKCKDAPMLSAESQMLSDVGREAQFHRDVVEMLEKGVGKHSDGLANDIANICPDLVENGCGGFNCVACLTRGLEHKGYGRQSEVVGANSATATGEWETIPNYQPNKLIAYRHICSVCKTTYKDIRPHGHKYCHECGAKMKGGAE